MANALPDFLRSEYPFPSQYLNLDSIQYHYLDEGPRQDHALVMVHGNPTWSFHYRNLVKAFSSTHRIIVPDHIGCGLSDKPQQYNYTLQTHMDNLDILLRHLQIKRMTLLVHDWGGPIGLGCGLRRPNDIDKIVLFNTAAFLSEQLPVRKRIPLRIRLCRIPMFGAVAVRAFNGFVKPALRMATAQPGGLPPLCAQGLAWPYNNWSHRIAIHRFVQDIPLSQRDASYPIVKEIEHKLQVWKDKQIHIFWGEKDFCFTMRVLQQWRERFPGATVETFPNAGHYVLEDAWQPIVHSLQKFLHS